MTRAGSRATSPLDEEPCGCSKEITTMLAHLYTFTRIAEFERKRRLAAAGPSRRRIERGSSRWLGRLAAMARRPARPRRLPA
jgi:hypothetical protein